MTVMIRRRTLIFTRARIKYAEQKEIFNFKKQNTFIKTFLKKKEKGKKITSFIPCTRGCNN